MRTTLTLALVLGVSACRAENEETTVTVFAAASTASLIEAFAAEYGQSHAVTWRLHFAASSTCARQIEAGAPADLFISANESWMSYLDERDLIESSPHELLANRLVFITPADAPVRIDVNATSMPIPDTRIAVGDPEHVPVGRYAAEALEAMGWWASLEPHLLPTADARSALRLVARGEVAVGIVYESDAVTNEAVHIAAVIPKQRHRPIRYPAAVCRDANEHAGAVLEALAAWATPETLSRFGFRAAPTSIPLER